MTLITLSAPPPTHTHTHTHTHHIRYDSPGQGAGPSQRLLHNNTQRSQQRDIHARSGIRIRIPRKLTAAGHVATGIGQLSFCGPEKAIEVQRKGKLILYSRSDLSICYLCWKYMNIDGLQAWNGIDGKVAKQSVLATSTDCP